MADEGTREKKSSKKREKEAQEEVSEEEKKVEETKTSSKKKEKEVAEEKSEEEDKKNGSEEAEKKDTKGKSKKNAKEVDQTAESAEESGDQASDDKPEEKTSKGKKSKEEKQSTESKPPRKKDRKEVVEASEESEEPVVEDKSKDKKKKKQDSIDPDQMPDSPRQNPNPEIPPAVGGKLFLKVAEIKVSQKPKDYYSALFFEKEEIWRTKVISKKTTFEEGGRLHALPEENTEKVPIRVVLFEKGLVGSLLDTQKGEVHLDISTLKDGYPYDKWFPLTNKKGQQKGEIHLQVMYIRKDGDSNGEEFNRPLHVLMKKSRLDLFTRMLEDPVANFDQTDDEGRTALLLAIEMNLSHYVDMLLKKGVDPRKQANNKGHTALHFAAQFRARREIVRALLDKKADPMVKDTDGDNTPLHAAAAADHVDALDLMLAVKKVDVNVKNKQGESPICAALRNGGSNAVRLLLRKGADIYLQNDNDLSVWELSQRKEYVNTEPRKVFMEELNVHDAREFPLRTKYPEKKLGTSKRVHQDYAKSTQVSVTVSEKTKAAFMITTLDANLRNSDFPGKTGFVVLKSDQGKHNEASLQLPSAVGIGGAKPLTLELEPGFFYNVIPYSKTKEVDSEYSLVVLTQEGKPSEIKDLVPWKYEEAQENDWTGKNAGGASQYDSFKNNIQYEVTFPKEDNVEFAVFLSQETNDPKSRMIQGGDHKIATYPHNIGFYVMDRTAAKILESTGSWTDRRDVVKFIKMDFSERNHVTIVPCTVKPGEESAYTLKVFCDQAISVKAK